MRDRQAKVTELKGNRTEEGPPRCARLVQRCRLRGSAAGHGLHPRHGHRSERLAVAHAVLVSALHDDAHLEDGPGLIGEGAQGAHDGDARGEFEELEFFRGRLPDLDLVDEFVLETAVGRGTTVTVIKWMR